MASLHVLALGFQSDHSLSFCPKVESFIPLRKKRRCCLSFTKTREIERERQATQKAFEWLKEKTVAPANAQEHREFRNLYRNVSARLQSVRKMQYGIWGWILSRLRSKKLNRELKLLETSLNRVIKTLQKNDQVSKALFNQLYSADSAIKDQHLFDQISQEMPTLITTFAPKSSDFESTEQTSIRKPFLLQKIKKEKRDHFKIFFPPVNANEPPEFVSFKYLRNLPLIVKAHRKQKLFESCKHMSCEEKEIHSSDELCHRVNKVHLKLNCCRHKPSSLSSTLVATYYNPVTGGPESAELVLKQRYSPQEVHTWVETLIKNNVSRLEEINTLSEGVSSEGIRPNFSLACWEANESVAGGVGEIISEPGLNDESLQRLQRRLVNRIANAQFFKENCRSENETYFVHQIGSRAYEVHKESNSYRILFSRLNAPIDLNQPLSAINRSDCQEICVVNDDEKLESVLNEKLNSYFPYSVECRHLVTCKEDLESLIKTTHIPSQLSRLVQTVALDWTQDRVTKQPQLEAYYWDLESGQIKVRRLCLSDSKISITAVTRWISSLKLTQFSASFSDPAQWKVAGRHQDFDYELQEEGITVESLKNLNQKINQLKANLNYYKRMSGGKNIVEYEKGNWLITITYKNKSFEINLKLKDPIIKSKKDPIIKSKVIDIHSKVIDESKENLEKQIKSILESTKNDKPNKRYLKKLQVKEGSFLIPYKAYTTKVTKTDNSYKLQIFCQKTNYSCSTKEISLISLLEKEIDNYVNEALPELTNVREFLAEPEELEEGKAILSRSVLKVELSRYLENGQLGLQLRYYDICEKKFISVKRLLSSFEGSLDKGIKLWISDHLKTNDSALEKIRASIRNKIDISIPVEISFGHENSLIADVQSEGSIGNGGVSIKLKVSGHSEDQIKQLADTLALHKKNQEFLESIKIRIPGGLVRYCVSIGDYQLSVMVKTVNQSPIYEVKIRKSIPDLSLTRHDFQDLCKENVFIDKDLEKFCQNLLDKHLPFGRACKNLINKKSLFDRYAKSKKEQLRVYFDKTDRSVAIEWVKEENSIVIEAMYYNGSKETFEHDSLKITKETTEESVTKWINELKNKKINPN